MKRKLIRTLLFIAVSLILSSCTFSFNVHSHEWSQYYDNGDGTHTRTCLTSIEHKETSLHNYNEGTTIKECDGLMCGKIKYTCTDCGYSKVEALYPGDDHTLDKKVVSSKYLYKEVSDYSAIYYMSNSEGVYGDESKLFEYNTLSDDYTLLDSVIADGNQYIDTGLSNDGYYYSSYSKQTNNNSSSRLPVGYQKVEYIESTGTQIINTGYADGLKVTVDCHMYAIGGTGNYWYGSQQDHENMMYNGLYNLTKLEYNWLTIDRISSNDLVMTQRISGSNTIITMNEETSIVATGTEAPTGNMYIFGCNGGARFYTGEDLRCYYFKMYNNNQLVRDFVPAVRNIDGKAGLYDLVESKFYESETEDNFISGPTFNNSCTDNSSKLPSGYSELDYIESTGDQEINTGVYFDMENGSIECTFETSFVEQDGLIVASKPVNRYDGNYYWFYNIYSWNSVSIFTSLNGDQLYAGVVNPDTSKHTAVYKNKTYYYDGNEIGSFSKNLTKTDNELYVSSWGGDYFYSGKIYSLKIYGANNELIRDYIPAIENVSGKVGLFDLVENKFYVSGTETEYIAGDVINYQVNNSIPSIYQEVEYLEGSGSQYIDTGIIYNPLTMKGEIKYSLGDKGISGKTVTYGSMDEGVTNAFYRCGNTHVVANENEYVTVGEKLEEDKTYIESFNNKELIINGTSYESDITPTKGKNNFFLFSYGTEDSSKTLSTCSSDRIYYFKVYENNVLAHNFVPVYRISDNVAGFYDTVTFKFLTNSGTGEFICGSKVNSSYYTNQLIDNRYIQLESIESTGTQYIDTEYVCNNGIRCYYEAAWTTGSNYIVGSQNPEAPYGRNSLYMDSERGFWELGYGELCPQDYDYERQFNKKYCIEFQTFIDNAYGIVDGDVLFSGLSGQTTINNRVYIFNNGYSLNNATSGRLYCCKIWSSENALVCDFIPAYDTVNKEAGLYDKVSKKFFANQGTGSFIAHFYDNNYSEYLGTLNKSLLEYTLPLEYQEVSNIDIESNTSIVTNEVLTNKSRLEISFKVNDNKDSMLIYASDTYNVQIIDKHIVLNIMGRQIASDKELEIGSVYKLVLGYSKDYVSDNLENTIEMVYPIFISSTNNLILFNDSNNTYDDGSLSLYKLNIYDDNKLKSSYIPCYQKSNNSIGLYNIKDNSFINFDDTALTSTGVSVNSSELMDTEIDSISLLQDYIKRDYIECDGTQYMDIGIKYNSKRNLKFVYEMSYTTNAIHDEYMGFWLNPPCSTVFGRSGGNNICGSSYSVKLNRIYALSYSINGLYSEYTVNGKTNNYTNSYSIEEGTPFTLFAPYNLIDKEEHYCQGCRLYSMKVYDNDCLIAYYIPCTQASTYINGLYDVVNDKFYSSATKYNLMVGNDDTYNIDDSNINLFYSNDSNIAYLKNASISYLSIKNAYGAMVREYIPVIRNSDGKVGLYDLVEKKFYSSSNGYDLKAGSILGHDYDEGVIVKEATYLEEGIKQYTCSLCGNTINETIDKLSYKVDIECFDSSIIKVYEDNNYSNYQNTAVAYTRNEYTFNYSVSGACIVFKVETGKKYEIIYDEGVLEEIDTNMYRYKNIASDCKIIVNEIN